MAVTEVQLVHPQTNPSHLQKQGLSGLAIASDITLKTWEAPTQPVDKQRETMLYYTAFHIPAE